MKTISQIEAESNAQIVANVNGRAVTRGELSEAFKKVQPKGHWKNAIDATLPLAEGEFAMITEAVIFFTGSVPEFQKVGAQYRVTAAGYFATIGA